MKELTQTQTIIFLLGGVLMVIGIGCFVFLWQQKIVCWIFLFGAILFSFMQLMQTYDGPSFVIRRLKRIQNLVLLACLKTAIGLIVSNAQTFSEMFPNALSYNKWVVLLLIAAVLEVYTTHRIASELKK